jgi:hypothetical protein
MSFRHLGRSLFQLAKRTTIHPRFYSSIQHSHRYGKCELTPIRAFSSLQTNDNAYRDLKTFLQKEIQSEKSAQKHPSNLPNIADFQVGARRFRISLIRFAVGSSQRSRSDTNATDGQRSDYGEIQRVEHGQRQ